MAIATAPRRRYVRSGGPRQRVEIERHDLVGAFMDASALAAEAMYANGAALQLLMRLDRDAAVEQAILATHDTHDRLMALLTALRTASGRYDRSPAT